MLVNKDNVFACARASSLLTFISYLLARTSTSSSTDIPFLSLGVWKALSSSTFFSYLLAATVRAVSLFRHSFLTAWHVFAHASTHSPDIPFWPLGGYWSDGEPPLLTTFVSYLLPPLVLWKHKFFIKIFFKKVDGTITTLFLNLCHEYVC